MMLIWKLSWLENSGSHKMFVAVICHCAMQKINCQLVSRTSSINSMLLVGGFNPFEKYESKWESSPIFGVKIKKSLKPPPRLVFLRDSIPSSRFAPLNVRRTCAAAASASMTAFPKAALETSGLNRRGGGSKVDHFETFERKGNVSQNSGGPPKWMVYDGKPY